MESVEGVKKQGKGKESRYGKRYGLEFKASLCEVTIGRRDPSFFVIKEVGAVRASLADGEGISRAGRGWLRNPPVPAGSRQKLPGPVREKIVEIKKRALCLVSSGFPTF